MNGVGMVQAKQNEQNSRMQETLDAHERLTIPSGTDRSYFTCSNQLVPDGKSTTCVGGTVEAEMLILSQDYQR